MKITKYCAHSPKSIQCAQRSFINNKLVGKAFPYYNLKNK